MEDPAIPRSTSCTNTTSFLPKATENPKYEISTDNIGLYFQHMQEHAFIGKFMGIWTIEKSLTW
jgi:hypothetical protein